MFSSIEISQDYEEMAFALFSFPPPKVKSYQDFFIILSPQDHHAIKLLNFSPLQSIHSITPPPKPAFLFEVSLQTNPADLNYQPSVRKKNNCRCCFKTPLREAGSCVFRYFH